MQPAKVEILRNAVPYSCQAFASLGSPCIKQRAASPRSAESIVTSSSQLVCTVGRTIDEEKLHLLQVEQKEAVSAIGEDMFSIAIDQPFRFPASFTFVLRAFTTLEGLGRTLDPDYKFAAVAQPYALQLLQLQVKKTAFQILRCTDSPAPLLSGGTSLSLQCA